MQLLNQIFSKLFTQLFYLVLEQNISYIHTKNTLSCQKCEPWRFETGSVSNNKKKLDEREKHAFSFPKQHYFTTFNSPGTDKRPVQSLKSCNMDSTIQVVQEEGKL